MQEITSKEPAIKLFGKKISLPVDCESSAISDEDSPSWERELEEEEQEEAEEKAEMEVKSQGRAAANIADTQPPDEEPSAPESLPETKVNTKKTSINKYSAKSQASRSEKEQNDATNSQGKTVKKPDKILPCPRCNSMDTKFCYYNNYNIDQPRHFCKACQRYWTAGGTIRNVPVGAGCRKNKNSTSRYRHIAISEALQATRTEGHNGTHRPAMTTNGRVLSFGLNTPICDSMASVSNLGDKKVLNGTQNGFYGLDEQRIAVSCVGRGKNGDDCSSRTSTTVSNSLAGAGKAFSEEPCMKNANGFAPSISCIPGVPWPYLWNSAFPPPAFCPPRFPMSFYPSSWNYSIPGPWSMGILSPQSCSSSNQNASCSNFISSTLGKHSRDGDMPKPDDLEEEGPSMHKNGCVLVPKVLRIDDPSEAAKGSLWASFRIKNESHSGGELFKAFQPKSDAKSHMAEASLVLGANPAALSRSINFHERT